MKRKERQRTWKEINVFKNKKQKLFVGLGANDINFNL